MPKPCNGLSDRGQERHAADDYRFGRGLRSQGSAIRSFVCPLPVSAHVSYLYWHASTNADPASQWLREQMLATGRSLTKSLGSQNNAQTRRVGAPARFALNEPNS